MEKKRLAFYESTATLVGTIIGAGIFGIPYVIAKAGFLAGLINLIVLGLVVLMINLYTGEISLRTKKTHQLAGFAELYLGKTGKTIMAFASIFGIIGALIAYLIGEGRALSAIFGGTPFLFSMIFFVIMTSIIYFDIKAVKKSELLLSGFMVALILAICLIALPSVNLSSLSDFNLTNIFLPYGVILFAFVGASAVPEMEVIQKNNKKELKKAIIIGTMIPFVVYLLFAIAVVGVTGIRTTEVATIGLGQALGQYMIIFGNVFAVLSMSTSFLLLGLALKWMFHYDYGISKAMAWALTCFIPLILFLAGVQSFIQVIGITGAVAGGIEGIMIVLIAKKAKEKSEVRPEFSFPLGWIFAILLIALFTAGIIYQFVF